MDTIETSGGELTTFFAEDHRRIDELLARLSRAQSGAEAKALVEALSAALMRHIAWEEETLFPAFEDKTGQEGAVVAEGMRIQHDELKQRLSELAASLPDGGAARRNMEAVVAEALADHNHAEEDFIYPWMDQELSTAEKRALLARLR